MPRDLRAQGPPAAQTVHPEPSQLESHVDPDAQAGDVLGPLARMLLRLARAELAGPINETART